MAVTKILARRGGLSQAIAYVLNGDKTEEQILTAAQGCLTSTACHDMAAVKQRWNKTDGVQLYHVIQSFRPGELSPELALEIAREFAREHLPGYQAVIGVHTDREHIHAHIVFNSVNQFTGEKYHSNAQSYYQQIRGISDRLCREHGLSVIMAGESAKAISYVEWLRRSKGQPTFRSMLEADLRAAIQDANDLGHFFLLMEHMGYEIHHGDRLGFRLRGQERFQYPGRRNTLFTEDGIRAAIQGNLAEIEAGSRPAVLSRPKYRPYLAHPKYTGFLALYIHYLYLLGKIEKRQYPPRMTPHLRQEVMRFEQYQAQFAFLRENDITTPADMAAFEQRTEETLGRLTRQRTLLNVRKKKRQKLYTALADVAFVSVNGQFGNMTGEEGARAAELCSAQYAVPCHIWTFMEHRGDPYTFCKALENSESCKVRCFSQGEIQVLKSSNELIEMEKEIIAYESYPLYAAGRH